MKIITDNAVYVQKNDMGFLNQTDLAIPASIFIKVFGGGVTIINDINRFDFIKFEEKSDIEFFKNLDWIVDYNLLKDLNEEELMDLGMKVAEEKNNIAKKFNSMDEEWRMNNQSIVYECERLDFKMYSIRDFLWFKQGHIKFTLPEDIEYPEGIKKETKLKKILSKFRKK